MSIIEDMTDEEFMAWMGSEDEDMARDLVQEDTDD